MNEKGQQESRQHYNSDYAKAYIETLQAPYTINKSKLLASMASQFKVTTVLDLGCNIHSSFKTEGSLKLQLKEVGIEYIGVDLSAEYFDPEFFIEQGIPKEQIFMDKKGIVGDILQSPVKSDSMEMVVCSDVLEHVPTPTQALKEIHRVLKNNGIALLVLPSFYKLDIANFDYIDKKRKSSHTEKTTIDDWINFCEENGLILDKENSKTLGIFSGLSYLAWLDEKFVPERLYLSSPETYSSQSMLHKKAKNIFSKYDTLFDQKISSQGLGDEFVEKLKQGDLKKIFQDLKTMAHEIISDQNDLQVIDKFFHEVSFAQCSPECISALQEIFSNAKFPKFFLGNSTLLVLKKKH